MRARPQCAIKPDSHAPRKYLPANERPLTGHPVRPGGKEESRKWIHAQVRDGVVDPHWQHSGLVGKLSVAYSKMLLKIGNCRYPLYSTPEAYVARYREISARRGASRIVLPFGGWLRGVLTAPNVGGNGRACPPDRKQLGLSLCQMAPSRLFLRAMRRPPRYLVPSLSSARIPPFFIRTRIGQGGMPVALSRPIPRHPGALGMSRSPLPPTTLYGVGGGATGGR